MFADLAWALGGAPSRGGSEPSLLVSLFPFILVFAIFYFLLIRPQQKRQQEHRRMLEDLRRGDHVVTSGGIFGEITKMKDDVLWVKVADNLRLRVQRSAISTRLGQRAKEAEEEEEEKEKG
ncbi:MAG: preprotein translocase subunit YajC [Nitrospinota bacterium]